MSINAKDIIDIDVLRNMFYGEIMLREALEAKLEELREDYSNIRTECEEMHKADRVACKKIDELRQSIEDLSVSNFKLRRENKELNAKCIEAEVHAKRMERGEFRR